MTKSTQGVPLDGTGRVVMADRARIRALTEGRPGWKLVLDVEDTLALLDALEQAEAMAYAYKADREWFSDQLVERTRERDALRAKISKVNRIHAWTNEDGRQFVFADDLLAALAGDGRE